MKVKILLFLSLIPVFTYATTFSYLDSEITPISINQKGEVLCKTEFSANLSGGGYAYDFVKYGFCVISQDSIHYFKGVTVGRVDDYSDEKYSFWDAIYNKATSEKQLKSIVSEVLKNSFEFSELNTEKFKVDTIIEKSAFHTQFGIDINETRQAALFGGLANKYSCRNKIHVAYDFGKVILLDNYSHWEDNIDEIYYEIGCDIGYYFKHGYSEGGYYDLYHITGVLFKHSSKE
jgi:hypothetical protein